MREKARQIFRWKRKVLTSCVAPFVVATRIFLMPITTSFAAFTVIPRISGSSFLVFGSAAVTVTLQ